MKKYLRVEMPDGSKWDIPVSVIAQNRADNRNQSIEEALAFFDIDDYEIKDWAANNMNWSDVETVAKKVCDGEASDYEDGWVSGDKEVIEK